jgi:DNA-binding beta-propeller fold protein YncE
VIVTKTTRTLGALLCFALPPYAASAAEPVLSFVKLWTNGPSATPGQLAEIPAFDPRTNTLWVVGVVGVDILNADNGELVGHLDTTAYGAVNSVAIHNGLAALAIESTNRTLPGVVVFFDTKTRAPSALPNVVTVGALPDMLTFNHDGTRLLVANEGTPSTYGPRLGTTVPRIYGPAPGDPPGSVPFIDVATRTLLANAGLAGVSLIGANVRLNTGMDFEPEYVAVDKDGTTAYVTLQEANAIGVLDLALNAFTTVIGLGAKNFNAPGSEIDPLNNGTVLFGTHPVKGLYMPDAIAAYKRNGRTYLVMANEGDFREDDGDRSAASSLGAMDPLNNLRISNTDSGPGNLFAAGGRSFSIRDAAGNLVYDSGDLLDKAAADAGIYDDGRSRDKGVEPEGVALLDIGGRTYAFVGLERTFTAAVAVFDIDDPTAPVFVDLIVTEGDVAPEGLAAYKFRGMDHLAIANEVSGTTTLYRIDRVTSNKR